MIDVHLVEPSYFSFSHRVTDVSVQWWCLYAGLMYCTADFKCPCIAGVAGEWFILTRMAMLYFLSELWSRSGRLDLETYQCLVSTEIVNISFLSRSQSFTPRAHDQLSPCDVMWSGLSNWYTLAPVLYVRDIL